MAAKDDNLPVLYQSKIAYSCDKCEFTELVLLEPKPKTSKVKRLSIQSDIRLYTA